MNIFRRIVSIFLSCFRKRLSTKTQDDMAAASGENCNSQLRPQKEGDNKHLSRDPSHVDSKTFPYGDHRGTSDSQRGEWAEEISQLKSENDSLKYKVKSERLQSKGDIAKAEARILQLEDDIAKAEARVTELQGAVNDGKAHLFQQMENCRKLQNEVRVKNDEINQLRSSNKRLEAAEKVLKNELGNVRNDLRNLETEYSKISDSGSYYENSATPTDASDAFSWLSSAVESFSKQLRKFVSGHPDKMEELRHSYGDVTGQQPSLRLSLLLKAEVMKILFEGFENESFNLDGGYCVYLDPVKRKKEFFALFLDIRNNKRGPASGIKGEQDDQFVKYYERSKTRVWQVFGLENSEDGLQSLEPAFIKAALSVWALHLLSFSFEPPASLFRIQNGAKFDRAYMVTPRFLDFDEDLLEKVEFVLTPGLRVDKVQLIKSEIYPVHVVHDQK